MKPTAVPVAEHLDNLVQRLGLTKVCVALGVFDGVHRGHGLILETLCREAAATHSVPLAFSFTPHPRAVLAPRTAPLLLTRDCQRVDLLAERGAAGVVLLPFSRDLAALEPEAFLEQHLFSGSVAIEAICVGQDWRFGRRGTGTVARLQADAARHGTRVISLPPFTLYGKPVSSTRIREALQSGRLSLAQRLLGRPYSIVGTVLHGKGIGQATFDCPTANVSAAGLVLPPAGVYAARVRRAAFPEEQLAAIAYIGSAPTVPRRDVGEEQQAGVEVHLFDFHGDLYNSTIEVAFLHFLRPDQRFSSIEALKQQIRLDVDTARSLGATSG